MRNRGNILFLILLAVVLFAALSYAVTSSLRGGGQDASNENAETGAAAIAQYVTLIRAEVQRMMLVNGCTTDNLDWRHNYYKRYDGTITYGTGGASPPPSPKSGCAVFAAYGGPISPIDFEKYKNRAYESLATTSDWRAGHGSFRWGNVKNVGTAANEIVLNFNGLDAKICAELQGTTVAGLSGTDGFNFVTDANVASPANITLAADQVDETINITGDFFARRTTPSSGNAWCTLGAVIVSQ